MEGVYAREGSWNQWNASSLLRCIYKYSYTFPGDNECFGIHYNARLIQSVKEFWIYLESLGTIFCAFQYISLELIGSHIFLLGYLTHLDNLPCWTSSCWYWLVSADPLFQLARHIFKQSRWAISSCILKTVYQIKSNHKRETSIE